MQSYYNIYIHIYIHIIYVTHILCIIICHISSWCFYFWPCDWSSIGSEGLLCMIRMRDDCHPSTTFRWAETRRGQRWFQEPSTARFWGVANWSAEKKWGNSVKFCAKVLTHPQIIPGFCRQTMKSCTPKMGTMGIDPVLAVTRVFLVWMFMKSGVSDCRSETFLLTRHLFIHECYL